MTCLTLAIGSSYEEGAEKLKRQLPNLVIVTDSDIRPQHRHEDPIIQSRLVKTGFAQYLPEALEPVVILDSDLETNGHVIDLPQTESVAGVSWSNVSYPKPFSEVGLHHPSLNSGMLIFASQHIASAVSKQWHQLYVRNLPIPRDEPSLALALHRLGIVPELLERKYNSNFRSKHAIFLHNV